MYINETVIRPSPLTGYCGMQPWHYEHCSRTNLFQEMTSGLRKCTWAATLIRVTTATVAERSRLTWPEVGMV